MTVARASRKRGHVAARHRQPRDARFDGLVEAGQVGDDHGAARRHGLEQRDGQPVLVAARRAHRREDRDVGLGIGAGEGLARELADEVDGQAGRGRLQSADARDRRPRWSGATCRGRSPRAPRAAGGSPSSRRACRRRGAARAHRSATRETRPAAASANCATCAPMGITYVVSGLAPSAMARSRMSAFMTVTARAWRSTLRLSARDTGSPSA